MALTFYVENQVHERQRAFTDDASNSFLTVCRRAKNSGTRVMDIIDPYADAMLNFVQLDRLIAELDAVLKAQLLSPDERRVVEEVLVASREARELSGYLFIEGD